MDLSAIFGKLGVGGRIPGKYPAPGDDNGGAFDLATASQGTDGNQPDSKPEVVVGNPAHNTA